MFTFFINKHILLSRPARILTKRIWNVVCVLHAHCIQSTETNIFLVDITEFLKCDIHNHSHSALLFNDIFLCFTFLSAYVSDKAWEALYMAIPLAAFSLSL